MFEKPKEQKEGRKEEKEVGEKEKQRGITHIHKNTGLSTDSHPANSMFQTFGFKLVCHTHTKDHTVCQVRMLWCHGYTNHITSGVPSPAIDMNLTKHKGCSAVLDKVT